MYGLVMLLAIPLGRYIGKIFNYESTWLDAVFNPIDKLFYKIGGINPAKEMNWKQHLVALLSINAVVSLLTAVRKNLKAVRTFLNAARSFLFAVDCFLLAVRIFLIAV